MLSAGNVDLSELAGEPCFGGLDLAATADVCSFVLIFPRPDGSVKVLPWMFVSQAAVDQRRGRTGASYDAFAAAGELIVTDGNSTDYDVIFTQMSKCADMFDVQSVAFDRWNSSALVQKLMDAGFDMDPFGQGFASMSQPIKQMEIMIKQKKLHHGGHGMLRWMASNIQTKTDEAMNIKFVKSKSGDKIDGMVALAMAVGEWMTNDNDNAGGSVYETNDIRFL